MKLTTIGLAGIIFLSGTSLSLANICKSSYDGLPFVGAQILSPCVSVPHNTYCLYGKKNYYAGNGWPAGGRWTRSACNYFECSSTNPNDCPFTLQEKNKQISGLSDSEIKN